VVLPVVVRIWWRFWSLFLWLCFKSVEICRFQSFKLVSNESRLLFIARVDRGVWFISLWHWFVWLERVFDTCCIFAGSCWYVDRFVLTTSSFAVSYLSKCSFIIFFAIWFRARTRVRWIASDEFVFTLVFLTF
jgi:hypothetical protein